MNYIDSPIPCGSLYAAIVVTNLHEVTPTFSACKCEGCTYACFDDSLGLETPLHNHF